MTKTKATPVKASLINPGDIILDHEGNPVPVLCSFRDGHGATASWHIECTRKGKPTMRIRGAPDLEIDLVRRAGDAAA